MKVGDKKQAVILGVVAVGSVGFLGKSVLESVMGGGSPQPAQSAPQTPRRQTSSSVTEQKSDPATPSTVPSTIPEVKAKQSSSESPADSDRVALKSPDQDVPIELYNDGFAAPVLGTDKKATNTDDTKKSEPATPKATNQTKTSPKSTVRKPLKGVFPLEVSSDRQSGNQLPDAKSSATPDENTGKDQQTKKENSKSTIRFCGLVESRKKMAIIELNGQSMTVGKGQHLGDDLFVVEVSYEWIKVQSGLSKFTIVLGGKRDL